MVDDASANNNPCQVAGHSKPLPYATTYLPYSHAASPPKDPVPTDIITMLLNLSNIDFFSRGRLGLYITGVPREGGGLVRIPGGSRIGPRPLFFFACGEVQLDNGR